MNFNDLAALGLILLFAADYIGIIVWLLRTPDLPNRTARFTMRGSLLAMLLVAVHLGMFATYFSELANARVPLAPPVLTSATS